MNKALGILLLLIGISLNLSAQQERDIANLGGDNQSIIYTQFAHGGINFFTHGYSLNFRRLWTDNAFYETGFEVELAMIRHRKENNIFSPNPQFVGGSSFPFGKLNSLYPIRIGYGQNREIADKYDIGSIEVNFFYFGGLSIGIVKPIYLEVVNQDNTRIIKERYDPEKHDFGNIYGGLPFYYGFSDMTVYPGLYAKAGLNFDYKIRNDKVGTLEVGTVMDYYFRTVPIMHDTKNYSFFIGFFVGVQFGKKWN